MTCEVAGTSVVQLIIAVVSVGVAVIDERTGSRALATAPAANSIAATTGTSGILDFIYCPIIANVICNEPAELVSRVRYSPRGVTRKNTPEAVKQA